MAFDRQSRAIILQTYGMWWINRRMRARARVRSCVCLLLQQPGVLSEYWYELPVACSSNDDLTKNTASKCQSVVCGSTLTLTSSAVL